MGVPSTGSSDDERARERDLLLGQVGAFVDALLQENRHLRSRVDALEARVAQLGETERGQAPPDELLSYVYVASQQLAAATDTPTLLRHVHDLVEQLVGAETYSIYLHDEAQNALVFAAGDDADASARAPIPLGADLPSLRARLVAFTFESQELFVSPTPHGSTPHGTAGENRTTENVAAAIPLCIGSRPIGVLCIDRIFEQKPAFGAVDLELFRLLSTQPVAMLLALFAISERGGTLPRPSALLRGVSAKLPQSSATAPQTEERT